MDKKEYHSKTQIVGLPKPVVFLMLFSFPLVGIGLIDVAVFFVLDVIGTNDRAAYIEVLILCILAIPAGGFCLALGWAYLSLGLAKYRFEPSGLAVKYPAREECLIPWEDFQQVCICYAAYPIRDELRTHTVICCVKHGEKHNWDRRWKTDNPFRYKTVICIHYTPELAEALQAVCPHSVVDLRETLAYKIYR